MYLHHYGLRDKPFRLAHDPSFYYPAAHQEAMDNLCYSIEERQGLATLVGETGTGKTTLLRNLLRSFSAGMRGILVSDVSLSGGSLLRQFTLGLELPVADAEAAPTILQSYLQNAVQMGQTVVLLVDEAQALTARQLEEVRYVSNLESRNQKLVQMILAGQPSLECKLEAPRYQALRQRVAVRSYLQPLSLEHTRAYIELRLQVAGSPDAQVFTPNALVRIHELSRGIPRLINLICDRALLFGYAEDRHLLDEAAVDEVFAELGIERGASEEARSYGAPEAQSGKQPSTSLPPSLPDSQSLETRLSALEQKLDVLVEAMRDLGLLNANDAESPQGALTEEHPQAKPSSEPPVPPRRPNSS